MIFFGIVFGAALTTLPDRTRDPLVALFEPLLHAIMNLTLSRGLAYSDPQPGKEVTR